MSANAAGLGRLLSSQGLHRSTMKAPCPDKEYASVFPSADHVGEITRAVAHKSKLVERAFAIRRIGVTLWEH